MHPAQDPIAQQAETKKVQDTFNGDVGASEWEAGC